MSNGISEAVVREITEQTERTGRADGWSITPERIAALARIGLADLYRAVYRTRETVETIAPASYGPGNVGDLAALLEELGGPAARGRLERAGVLLDHEARVELMRELQEQVDAVTRTHRIDAEAFAAMMRVHGDYRKAVETYLAHHFDLAAVRKKAADSFVAAGGFGLEAIARDAARKYVALLFRRKVVTADAFFAPVEERLRRLSGKDTAPTVAVDASLRSALSDMAMGRPPANRKELRDRYRLLMKTYHPDVNPRGLEMSRRINAAYSLILSRMPR